MVMTAILGREGLFAAASRALVRRCDSARSLLLRVCGICALLAAAVTNDTVCVFVTPVVTRLCHQLRFFAALHLPKRFKIIFLQFAACFSVIILFFWHICTDLARRFDLPYLPFLLAIATSANIGSALSPIGNPQNMIIASLSGLKFADFIVHCGPAALIGWCVNSALLIVMFRVELDRPLRRRQSHHYNGHGDAKEDLPSSAVHSGLSDAQQEDDHVLVAAAKDSAASPQSASSSHSSAAACSSSVPLTTAHNSSSICAPSFAESNAETHAAASVTRIAEKVLSRAVVIAMASDGRISALSEPPRTRHDGGISLYARSASSSDGDVVTNECPNEDENKVEIGNTALDDHRSAAGATTIQRFASGPDVDDIFLDDEIRLENASSPSFSMLALSPVSQRRRLVLYAIFLGTLVAFACGAPLGWTAVGGAALMLLADCRADADADATLALVDWPLLVFFAALFVAVAGFERTGVPARVWHSAAPRAAMTAPGGVALFAVLVRPRAGLRANAR